ncbi:hypothetical protein G5V59_02525 [Nocardioides sp. W3-2-3]|uniref:hypothetical protein n=1 Tax=Nocardioides convexus TaxID=2712224 RepID=UPI002418B2DF|nr:hypothetical protein [Nocardioides convexus]NGZ99628.1 hypothetical protein [Nocardioides convexus]
MASLIQHSREGSRRARFEPAGGAHHERPRAVRLRHAHRPRDAAELRRAAEAVGQVPDADHGQEPSSRSTSPRLYLGAQTFKDVPERTAYPEAQGPALSEYPIQVKKTGLLWGFRLRGPGQRRPRPADDGAEPDAADGRRHRGRPRAPAHDQPRHRCAEHGVLQRRQRQRRHAEAQRHQPADRHHEPAHEAGPALRRDHPRRHAAGSWSARRWSSRPSGSSRPPRLLVDDGNGGYIRQPNPLKGKVELVVNEKQIGQSWIVMPKPGTTIRAPFWEAFLVGYETPDFRQKADGGRAIGGGDVVLTGSLRRRHDLVPRSSHRRRSGR